MTEELVFDNKMHVVTRSVSIPIIDGELLPYSEYDLLVVNAARVSVDGYSTGLSTRDVGLLKRLVTDVHGSPFEHAYIGFEVEVPIFVERQWRTHRWSSFNEHSGRYSEMLPKGYVPESLHTQEGGAMDYKRTVLYDSWHARMSMQQSMQSAWAAYQSLLGDGVAKEEARMVLPVGMYTKFVWTANLRSIANFLSLRTDVHAQLQIREAAAKVEDIFKTYFPYVHEVWDNAGRKPLGA